MSDIMSAHRIATAQEEERMLRKILWRRFYMIYPLCAVFFLFGFITATAIYVYLFT